MLIKDNWTGTLRVIVNITQIVSTNNLYFSSVPPLLEKVVTQYLEWYVEGKCKQTK